MHIDLIVACEYFQRRLCWMLSSILQQRNPPGLTVDIAYAIGNGNPTTEAAVDLFAQQGVDIRSTICSSEIKGNRGAVRDLQLRQSEADVVLFADCDHVYDPDFFADLAQQLSGPLKDETKCMVSTRISLGKDYCKNYFNDPNHPWTYPCIIPNVADVVRDWPVYRISPAMGAGYFQMAWRTATLKYPHGDRGWHTSSDKRFRKQLGGIHKIQTKPQYHLNHERPREEGLPDDIQR